MGLTVNTNIAALNAYRNLNATQSSLSKSLEKLSSGYRINRAADDAAGLAISEGLKSQVGGLTVAARNAQDGISVVQTAEGSLTEVHSILQRLRDLSVQASNDSNNDKARANIKTEATSLVSELDRIRKSTNFNGTNLLDGTAGTLNFQVGADGDANSNIAVDMKDINVSFPADYHAEELKGKPVVFKVTVNDIQQKALPELNEEFAQKLEHKSLADFKDQVRKEIEGSEKGRIEGETRDQLLKKFVEANPIEVPKSLLEEQRKALVADFKNRLQQQGFNDSNFDEYQQKWNDDFDKTAEFMVKSAFLIDKLAEDEKLTATDKDVDAKFEEMAKQWGMEKEKIKQFYKEKQGLDRMKYQITEDNVFQYLLKNSQVQEVIKPAKTEAKA